MIRILTSAQIDKILARRTARLDAVEKVVRPILEAVRRRGDDALVEYARKFDGFNAESIRVPQQDLANAEAQLPAAFKDAVKCATANIRAFAQSQMPTEQTQQLARGLRVGCIVRPLDTIAAYIPAGRYPLPSTLMMTVVPAQVAGVKNVCVASPHPTVEILGTAHMLGAANFYQMGGAQAIAAFAFGTESVPRADRIVGPGNVYVAVAKKLLAGEVGIDFVAGPTEIVIIAADGDPAFIAADMLAQAEHDVDASAMLLTPSRRLAETVVVELERQLKTLPTAEVARKSLERNGAIVIVENLEEAVDISNRIAPEHLSISEERLLKKITHAGSVFIGPFSTEAAGDYASGPNHVLPTNGAARLRGGLSAADFVKVISVQRLSRDALRKLAPAITTLARAEGLEAHARSVEIRNRVK